MLAGRYHDIKFYRAYRTRAFPTRLIRNNFPGEKEEERCGTAEVILPGGGCRVNNVR